MTLALAELKGQAVLDLVTDSPAVVIACDSVLEFRGQIFGKPKDAAQARDRWRKMRGSGGVLHTGHFVAARTNDTWRISKRVANTVVRFADLSDAEIDAYIETGEPLFVAGAFTIDGLGGPFIIRIDGDPHNVVGISLPLVRQMLLDLEIPWHTLWKRKDSAGAARRLIVWPLLASQRQPAHLFARRERTVPAFPGEGHRAVGEPCDFIAERGHEFA